MHFLLINVEYITKSLLIQSKKAHNFKENYWKITKDETELFKEYENTQFEIANEYNEEYFAKGFELGLKIATEVFYKQM